VENGIMCLRATGEIVFVLGTYDSGNIRVRRPIMTRDGILHQEDSFTAAEIETVESHLKRELEEMKLKAKLQKEAFAEEEEAQLASKKTDISIN
jgi:hypothetical protein